MSEEQTNTEEQTTTEEQSTSFTQADVDRIVGEAVKTAVKSKEGDLVKQIRTLKGELKQSQTAQADRAKQEAIESENFKSLYEAEAEAAKTLREESTTTIAKLQNQLVTNELKQALPDHIKADDIAFKGYMVSYNEIDPEGRPSPTDWVAQIKADNPDKFESPKASVGTSNAQPGGVAQGSGSSLSLEERLKSPDKNVKLAAAREKLRGQLG
jgi:hypothetical protein